MAMSMSSTSRSLRLCTHVMVVCVIGSVSKYSPSLPSTSSSSPRPSRPNVLYIVIDDLRPELPPYGQRYVHAPNLQRLADRSLLFERAYCNQPVCSPSRNSFLSGRRPSHTKIWNFISDFRAVGQNWTTLPSHFKSCGYLTLGTGKIYHEGHPANGDGNKSWSENPVQFACGADGNFTGTGYYCDPGSLLCHENGTTNAPNPNWCGIDLPMNTSTNGSFGDITTLNDATAKLRYAAATRNATGQPFFVGVGLKKPHLDWRVPQGFVDLYPNVDDIAVATHPTAQLGRPAVSIHGPYQRTQNENQWTGWGYTDPWTPMRPASAREMRQHYWAAISFMDSIVGRLLTELTATGCANETLVVFHSDHGWSLGENGDWKKFSLTELGTRVPLLIAAPWLPHTHGQRTNAIVELVDVMPTMAALVGLPPPIVHAGEPPLDGISLLPLFSPTPPSSVKAYALSVYPRCPTHADQLWRQNFCIEVVDSKFQWMGYSLRGNASRYTAWFPWNGTSLTPIITSSTAIATSTINTSTTTLINTSPPINGSNGFYNELFVYTNATTPRGGEEDLNELEVVERTAMDPQQVMTMHAALLKMIENE